jgi:Flp pilus assembly protein TadD
MLYAKAFNNRGVVYRTKGEFDRAMEDFNEAIKLAPDYASPFANRAAIHAVRASMTVRFGTMMK